MRTLMILPLALLLACEPPPALDGSGQSSAPDNGDPDIHIVFPPSLDPVSGTGPYLVPMDVDGNYTLHVIVDITGIELRDPYTEELAASEEEGHWHLEVSGDNNTVPASKRFATVVFDGADVDGGEVFVLTASMRSNDHSRRTLVNGSSVEDTVEVGLAVP